ncbi:unnamed protein product, partial [Iphiclides podalirius]
MIYIKSLTLFVLVLVAVTAISWAQVPQGGPHSPQWRPRLSQQVPQDASEISYNELTETDAKTRNWTSCDPLGPKLSCYDCNTRLVFLIVFLPT